MAKRAMLASQRSMPRPWPGPASGDGGEGRVGCPAGDGCAAGDEEGGEQGERGRAAVSQRPSGVEAREGHAAGADLGGEDEVAEAGLRGDGEDEEEHQRAVQGDEGEVLFGQDGAVEGELPVGPGEVEAHERARAGCR